MMRPTFNAHILKVIHSDFLNISHYIKQMTRHEDLDLGRHIPAILENFLLLCYDMP